MTGDLLNPQAASRPTAQKVNQETRKDKRQDQGAMAYTREDIQNVSVNIRVVGRTGTGKSSWINQFRGITNRRSSIYVKVGTGSIECTTAMKCYPFEDNPKLKLWDLPAANTAKFPIKSYAKDTKLHLYDAFVFLTKCRFEKSDSDVVNLIVKTKKPCYFGRTHIDVDIENETTELSEEGVNNGTEMLSKLEDFAKDIREKFQAAIISQGSKMKPTEVFLLTINLERDMNGWVADNDRLKVKLLEGLPDLLQRAAITLAMFPNTPEKVEKKVKELKRWIYGASLASAAGGAIPVPGVSIALDLSIAARNAFYQLKALGIDGNSIEIRTMGYQRRMWTKEEILEEVKRRAGEGDELLVSWLPSILGNTAKDIDLALSRLIVLVPSLVVLIAAEATGEALKASIVLAIPGMILGVGASGAATYVLLSKLLETNKKIALAIIDILNS